MEFTKNNLNKTLWVKPEILEKNRKRFKIDAEGKTLGKLAVEIADRLIGKNNAHYCDHRDCGSFVIVDNAEKLVVTGKKLQQKMYHTYSGYKGNVKSMDLGTLLKKNPVKVLWFAVRGMLPKNKLRDPRMKRLKLFVGNSAKYDNLHPEIIK